MRPVDWENTKLFVEYGPGVGTFTRPMLEKLGAGREAGDDRHQPGLHAAISSESIDDPRLVAVTGSAADVEKILADHGLGSADYVLSGLPFSTLPPGVGDDIAEATAKVIRPGGAFLVYQFSPKVLRLHQAALRARSSAASNGSTFRRRRCSGRTRASRRPNAPARKFSRRVTV